MPKRLVLCRCDPAWPAFAVCDVCELVWLEERLTARELLRPGHPAAMAFGTLVSHTIASLPLDQPLAELAELVAAITRSERERGHAIDLRIVGDHLDVLEVAA